MAIDFAKVFPGSHRQDLFTTCQRDAAEQKHITSNDRKRGTAANACVQLGTARGAVEQNEDAYASNEKGAEEEQHNEGCQVRCTFGHFLAPCKRVYPAIASGSAPRVRSRLLNSCTAHSRSATVKSGHLFGKKTNSANAHSHKRKSESRCSPPVRMRR